MMAARLPEQYKDLLSVYKTPLARECMALYGIREAQGDADNPVILSWAKEVNSTISQWYRKDAEPWCALYMSVCLRRAGYQPPDGFDAVRASAFAKVGDPIHGEPVLWDILVFKRSGGGHVALYVGEDETCYHCLGGNQGDIVSIIRIPKDRLVTARREPLNSCVASKVRVYRDGSGRISENEK